MLFQNIVFGPIKSRRFGISLGVNLLPDNIKYCSFNCIYCECGLTDPEQERQAKLHPTDTVLEALESSFREFSLKGLKPDNITFAGNGEPTMHPGFSEIIDKTVALRDELFPSAKITVLSNATALHKEKVRNALRKIDNNVQKLDAGTEEMYQAIDRPFSGKNLSQIVDELMCFEGRVIIQTLFLRGVVRGTAIDNTTDSEVSLWLEHLQKIKPLKVMLYAIDRATPEEGLVKLTKEELEQIATKVRALHIEAEVFS